ncbi:uncharacterized protein PG998_009137 [Apiospora kogelbergensis]|uniref:Uncharacterized protein n=1 Tax=Apiospora kogelbergensis TaxID=1337665 RepID=A0AAW0R721_9PEZI
MAGPTTAKKGANPAPDYTSMFNSIELLQSARTRKALASSSATLSQRRAAQQQPPTTNPAITNGGKSSKSAARTAALLAQAKAEEADLDRLAMDDDNAGVGLHGGPKTAEQLARLREDRKLASRLLGKKRRADEAKGQRMRGEDPSSDDEPGRSGVGRAKKKARRDVIVAVADDKAQVKQASSPEDVDTDMKDGDEGEATASAAGTEKVEKTPANSSEEDQQDKETEVAAKRAASIGDQPKATDGNNPEVEAVSKKKRKKKNKKKAKAAAPQGDS